MAASSRGVSAARGLWQTSRLCTRCATTGATIRAPAFSAAPIFRSYSGAAAAATTAASGSPTDLPPNLTVPAEPKATQAPKSQYKLKGGIILTRAPLLTAEPTKFEEAFYFYQKRLNERLCMPFVTKVYFKPDTPGLMDWNIKVGERKGTPGKEVGVYQGKSASAWQDELMVGDDLSSHKKMYETLLKDAEARVSDEAEIIPEEDRVPVEPLPPRVTEADIKGDTTRLDRAMDRTLYFVVKGEDGKWQFPSTPLDTEHNLHQAARYVMNRTAGVNMNTWLVGRVPVAHRVVPPTLAEDGTVKARGEKTFFIKGRIMAGQADLNGNPYGYTEFRWLTREELKRDLEPEYFHAVRNMMADR